MAPIGYIVQFANEEDYTVYHGFVKLHRTFKDAVDHAADLYKGFIETNGGENVDLFNTYAPTKKSCDMYGSVVIFESPAYIVWIDCVIE